MDELVNFTNVALGKAATQSSIHPWWNAVSTEADAAQGNNGQIGFAAGFNTARENCPWWQVDLGVVQSVRAAVIYNRVDAGSESFDVAIGASPDGVAWDILDVRTIAGDPRPVTCRFAERTQARFVRVTRIGFGELHLDEIQVFAAADADGGGPAAAGEQPRFACLTMQKDERLLLQPWLLHHGRLFGYRNLYVLDNGSSDPRVRDTLKAFERVGVNVIWEFDTPGHFDAKGGYIGEVIHGLKASQSHDLALPLDCDEFVAVTTPGGVRCGQAEVYAELRRIYTGGRVCRTSQCLYNVPGSLEHFKYAFHRKCIFPVRLFDGMDHGFHRANLAAGDGYGYGATALTYLHFHFKPFAHLLQGAADKLRPWVDPGDLDALRGYGGVGLHLKKYFFMDAAEYDRFDVNPGAPVVRCEEFLGGLGEEFDTKAFVGAWRGAKSHPTLRLLS